VLGVGTIQTGRGYALEFSVVYLFVHFGSQFTHRSLPLQLRPFYRRGGGVGVGVGWGGGCGVGLLIPTILTRRTDDSILMDITMLCAMTLMQFRWIHYKDEMLSL